MTLTNLVRNGFNKLKDSVKFIAVPLAAVMLAAAPLEAVNDTKASSNSGGYGGYTLNRSYSGGNRTSSPGRVNIDFNRGTVTAPYTINGARGYGTINASNNQVTFGLGDISVSTQFDSSKMKFNQGIFDSDVAKLVSKYSKVSDKAIRVISKDRTNYSDGFEYKIMVGFDRNGDKKITGTKEYEEYGVLVDRFGNCNKGSYNGTLSSLESSLRSFVDGN